MPSGDQELIMKINKLSAHVTLIVLTTLLLPFTVPSAGLSVVRTAYAEESWKERIMELCAKTDVAMSLTSEELKELVAGCDKLKPVIESLEETPRKVYRKRLQMCRDLFAYVLESKEPKDKMTK
jgi:hypothetical protein